MAVDESLTQLFQLMASWLMANWLPGYLVSLLQKFFDDDIGVTLYEKASNIGCMPFLKSN